MQSRHTSACPTELPSRPLKKSARSSDHKTELAPSDVASRRAGPVELFQELQTPAKPFNSHEIKYIEFVGSGQKARTFHMEIDDNPTPWSCNSSS